MQDQAMAITGAMEGLQGPDNSAWLTEIHAITDLWHQTGKRSPEINHSEPNSAGNQAQKTAHELTICESTAGTRFVEALAHSFAYSLVQSPLEGLSQTFDHTIGAPVGSNLYGSTKDLLVSAPAPTRFGTSEWHGQSVGSALGAIPWFIAARAALRSSAETFQLTKSLVVAPLEGLANQGLFSSAGLKLTLEGGMTGATYSGLLKPIEPQEKSWGTEKLKTMAADFATFSALSAGTIVVTPKLGALVLPAVEKYPAASQLIGRGTNALAGAISGMPAAAAETGAQYLLSDGKNKPGLREFAKNAYAFGVIGAGMNAFGPVAGKKIEGTATVEKPNAVATTEEKPNAVATTEEKPTDRKPINLTQLGEKTIAEKPFSETAIAESSQAPTNEYHKVTLSVPVIKQTLMAEFDSAPGEYSDLEYESLPAINKNHIGYPPPDLIYHSNDHLFSKPNYSNLERSEIATSELAEHFPTLPNAYEFKERLGKAIVGTLPEPFETTGLTTSETYKVLNNLAKALRSLDTVLPPQKKNGLGAQDLAMPPFQIGLGAKSITASKIGIGEVAHVYKISLDGHDYAFKVPNDPARMDVHGSYAETAAFTYLSKKKISDLIDFYAANPAPSGGWMLTEFVSKPVQREGEPLAHVLADEGLVFGDDWAPNRGPGNIVWDLGGIEPKNVKAPRSVEELEQLLNTPEGAMIAGRKLHNIKDKSALKQALLLCLERPEIAGQVARTAVQRLRTPADLHDVLNKALETTGGAGRAAFELDVMRGTPFIKELFYKALNNPESRIEATKMIDKLPLEERKAAFDAAFVYPEARAMAARSIPSLPIADRDKATEQALEFPGSKYIVYQQLSKTKSLTPAEREEMNSALSHYWQSHNLDSSDSQKSNTSYATFEERLKRPDANPHGLNVSDVDKTSIQDMWKDLTDLQKDMSAGDLIELSHFWHRLNVEQWKSLTPNEVREQLRISIRFSLGYHEHGALVEKPDLIAWLRHNNYVGQHEFRKILTHWNDLPVAFKQLPDKTLSDIAETYGYLDKREWKTLSAADAADVSFALKNLHLDANHSSKLVAHLDYAKWYKQNRVKLISLNQASAGDVLDVWDRLEPEQKSLPIKQLVKAVGDLKNSKAIYALLGSSSTVPDYLLSIDVGDGKYLSSVSSWLQRLNTLDTETVEKAKTMLETMAKEGVQKSDFTETALRVRFDMENLFGQKPEVKAKLELIFTSPEHADELFDFMNISKHFEEGNKKLLEIALKNGFSGTANDMARFKAAAYFSNTLSIGDKSLENVYKLADNPEQLSELQVYMGESANKGNHVKELIENGADWSQLNIKHLVAESYFKRLNGFNDQQKQQLKDLNNHGLQIGRLVNYLEDAQHGTEAVKVLLEQGADVRQLNSLMRLSVYPEDVAVKLVEADRESKITTEDVVGKTKDWQSGRDFRRLLIKQVKENSELSLQSLQSLSARAAKISAMSNQNTVQPVAEHPLELAGPAGAFVRAADSIMKTVPADTPIVLLGRDTWPLVPVLRARGRDAQYFMWSRLQYSDAPTQKQWLKEVPPGAAVVDTGFGGTIISNIGKIDLVSGYLMSSVTHKYPSLLGGLKNFKMVSEIEALPKLIDRSSTHTASGGAVARRKGHSEDGNGPRTVEGKNRWNTERLSRELLRATGLPAWDVWRYSQFVGLTPQERLGLSTKEQLEQHYKNVEALRSQKQKPDFALPVL